MAKKKVETEAASEESYFYHTITAFENLVKEYGFDEIIANISDDLYMEMFDFFVPAVDEEEHDNDSL